MPFENYEKSQATNTAARVLEFFASSAKISFDRPIAQRTIAEMVRTIPGDDFRVWGQRLVEAGESLNLRIRSTDLALADVMRLVRQGIPVAVCFTPEDNGNAPWVEWIALDRMHRGKVHVLTFHENKEEWLTPRQLRKRLARGGKLAELRWVSGQAALPCQIERSDVTGHKAPIKPLERLLGLIRAEKSDLWAVFIFSIVVGILALASPIAVEALVNTVAFGKYLQPILVLSLILMIFLGFAAAIRALNTFIVEIIQRRLFVRVVEDLAYRLPRVEQKSIDAYFAPELVNRFFDVVTVQKVAAALMLDGITIVLQTMIGMAVLAFYHPFLLGFDAFLLVSIGFIVFGLGRGAVKTAIRESACKYEVAAWLEELSRHPTAFKLHGGSQFGLDRADKLAVDYLDARKAHFRVLIRQILFALGLQAVAATVLLGLGGWLVIQGELTLGQLVAAELIVMTIVGSFAKIGKHLEGFYDLLASVEKLGKLFDLPIERHDKLFHLQDATAASLAFQSVSQTVGKAKLHSGLTFELSPGDSLAVMGPAASGKSVLLDLVTGVRQPSDGHVTLDGIDLRELRPDSLREHVSLARGSEVFRGTIEENVHLNRPQINASDVRESLIAVGLLDEIMRLPDGLSTRVQTNGAPLTESQVRRLMIARAIVGRPRLLLIDGTLDGLQDEALQTTLDDLCAPTRPWTLMVATGRQDIAARMEKTLDLSEGKIRPNLMASERK